MRGVSFEVTGISIPWFGVQWQKKKGDKEVARRVIRFLEDRRVLFPYRERDPEHAIHCVRSAIEIRHFLTEEIDKAKPGGGLSETLLAMRAAARRFVDAGGHDGQNWRASRRRTAGTDPFSVALGELRTSMGLHIATIAKTFDIQVDEALAGIMPADPAEDD